MPADRSGRPLARLGASTRTVRGRTTITTLAVVGLASVIAAAALIVVLRALLTEDLVKSTRLRVTEVSRFTTTAVRTTGRLPQTLGVSDPDDEFVQLVSPTGRVVAASDNVRGLPPQAIPGTDPVEITGPLDESPLIVVSGPVDALATAYGPVTALVGRSVDTVDDVTQIVTLLLAGGMPLMLAVIGTAAWRYTGRALAPVEAIRAEVESISSTQLHRRVPEPAAEDEIARLARTMNRMLGRLEQSVYRQRRFTADASHELRSPVAAIRQHAEVSQTHPARYPGSALAGTVLAEALRMQRLVDDLLLLAKADESSPPGVREPVDLDDLVFADAARLRSDTALRVDTAAVSAGRIDGEPDALSRLLRNLTDNAARHAAHRVRLRLVERADRVLLTVEDDGPGIPEDDRERVLERFVRLDEARARDHGGSGLGLAIVAELARAHDATLRIDQGELGGARVELSFPCSTDPA